MEDRVSFDKVLHLLIDELIVSFERYIELKKVDRGKIYIEIFKRSPIVSHEIRAVAINLLTSFKTADVPISEDAVQKKISHLVEITLQQDLIECALNAEDVSKNVHLSIDDLHKVLYKCSVSDVTSIASSVMHPLTSIFLKDGAFSLNTAQSLFSTLHTKEASEDISFQLSNQFENSQNEFENELSQLKSALGTGFSILDLKLSDINSKCEDRCGASNGDCNKVSKVPTAGVEDWLQSVVASKEKHVCIDDNSFEFPTIDSCFHSWEDRMRQLVPCHLYTTELTGKEVAQNIIEEDPYTFRSLHDLPSVLSEDDFIYDTLDLLVGIPSSTFLYDKNKRKFQMKYNALLLKLSHESTSRFSEKFVESGTMFHKLKTFCAEVIHTEGLVLKGLKDGINEILCVYMEYIVSVKANNPTMHMLRTDIAENAELLNTLGVICGISSNGSSSPIPTLPKGLALLSFLNKSSWSFKCSGNAIMVAVLLKFAYTPYFNFLNKWLSEGVCCDPYGEFQIAEDIKYLDRKDELYWKFTYTDIEEDNTRIIPTEIEKYSHDILQCGKSMRLLQNCCPQLYSLEYMCCNPPPSLSMVFSYHAVDLKRKECESYISLKESCELMHKERASFATEDEFHVEKQLLVERKVILNQIEKRWHHRKAPVNAVTEVALNKSKSTAENFKRWKSFPDIAVQSESNGFSGIVHESIGLLFSSSSYCDGTVSSKKQMDSSLHFGKFNQQLNLKSYFHAIPYTPEEFKSDVFKKHIHSADIRILSSGMDFCQKTLPPVEAGVYRSSNLPPGSFMDSLASLLVSEYRDSKEDICSCIQMTSLQNLMQNNFSAVMNMRMHLVQKTVLDYVINHIKIQDLLLCLRNTYFFQDESFSQSLCKRLFNWAMKCPSLGEFADWSILNEQLTRSVAVPSLRKFSCLQSASVNFVTIPEDYISKKNKFMQFFHFEFKIDWPLNIIIHKACITQYSNIFKFFLEMEFLCWLLGKIWRSLVIDGKDKHLENSPQYRKVMLDRFDMHQFIRVLRNCIHQDLGGPLWEFLLKSLRTEEISIDALEGIHVQYLERALARCFLTEDTAHLCKVLEFLFQQVYKFCHAALDCSWKLNPRTNYYESSEFESLSDSYRIYQRSKESFYERISMIVRRREFVKAYDAHYQLYYETLLETGRNISS